MSPQRTRTRQRRLPVARHGALKSPHPLAQIFTVIGAIVGVVAISATLVAGFAVWDAARAVDEAAVPLEGDDPSSLPPTIGEIEGGVNLLMVGTDSCEGQDVALFPRCANSDSPGERNDVTMLLHISDEPRPRDRHFLPA